LMQWLLQSQHLRRSKATDLKHKNKEKMTEVEEC